MNIVSNMENWVVISYICQHDSTERVISIKNLVTINVINDVIMSATASQMTGVSMVCSTVCSGADDRMQQNSASLAFVRGIHR